MKMKPSLSVIIPVYNEAKNLEGAVAGVREAVANRFSRHEILIVDDGSTDKTAEVASKLAAADPAIRILHRAQNRGLGLCYQEGVDNAHYDYVAWIPGDDDVEHASVAAIFSHVGEADILVPYLDVDRVRPWARRKISRLWILFLNFFFGFRLRYYNGPCVYKREIIREIRVGTDSFGILAATLVCALKRGCSYKEIPFNHQGRRFGSTNIFRLKNILGTLKTVLTLFWRVYFGGWARR